MDVERTIEFILDMQAKAEVRAAQADERAAQADERAARADARAAKHEARMDKADERMDKFDKRLVEEEAWLRQGVKARRTRDEGRVRALMAMRQERAARREAPGSVRLRIERAPSSGQVVLEADDVSKAFVMLF